MPGNSSKLPVGRWSDCGNVIVGEPVQVWTQVAVSDGSMPVLRRPKCHGHFPGDQQSASVYDISCHSLVA